MVARIRIRRATFADAASISHVITQTVKEINSKDYSTAVIDEVISNFTPNRVADSLENNIVRSVFVLPGNQRNNIGRRLLNCLEKTAKEQNINYLTVSSSIAAENFYRKLGYKSLRDEYYGEERTIIMEKHI